MPPAEGAEGAEQEQAAKVALDQEAVEEFYRETLTQEKAVAFIAGKLHFEEYTTNVKEAIQAEIYEQMLRYAPPREEGEERRDGAGFQACADETTFTQSSSERILMAESKGLSNPWTAPPPSLALSTHAPTLAGLTLEASLADTCSFSFHYGRICCHLAAGRAVTRRPAASALSRRRPSSGCSQASSSR